MSLEIYEQWQGTKLTLSISGRLDAVGAARLQDYFERVRNGASSLILDFSSLDYISSTGLRTLLIMLKWMKGKGRTFRIAHLPEAIRDVFNVSGFINLFIQDDLSVIVQTEKTSRRSVYKLLGDINVEALFQIKILFQELETSALTEVVLDFSDVSSLCPNAMETFEGAKIKFKSRNKELVLQNLAPALLR